VLRDALLPACTRGHGEAGNQRLEIKVAGTAGNSASDDILIGIGEGGLSLLAGAHRFPRRCTHESPERRSPVAVLATGVCVREDRLFERVAVLRSGGDGGKTRREGRV